MNMENYKNFIDRVTASDETVNRIVSNAVRLNGTTVHRRKKFRYPAAVIAACAVFVCGISVAAAGGFIDFEEIFGKYFNVTDIELANSLISSVSDVKYKVSDSDYKIDIKGAAGDEYNIMVIMEISRVDGEPVTAHFKNPLEENDITQGMFGVDRKSFPGSAGYSYDFYINDSGNIEYVVDCNSRESIRGRTITFAGQDIFPFVKYTSMVFDSGIYYGMDEGKWGYLHNEDNSPAEFDDSDIILLDLDWNLSFRYEPSEEAMKTKICEPLNGDFIFRQTVYPINADGTSRGDEFMIENPAVINEITVSSIGGRISFEYPVNEYERGNDSACYSRKSEYMECYLIKTDGSQIPAQISGGSAKADTQANINRCVCNIIYTKDHKIKTIAPIDEITAICIDGTVYELS